MITRRDFARDLSRFASALALGAGATAIALPAVAGQAPPPVAAGRYTLVAYCLHSPDEERTYEAGLVCRVAISPDRSWRVTVERMGDGANICCTTAGRAGRRALRDVGPMGRMLSFVSPSSLGATLAGD